MSIENLLEQSFKSGYTLGRHDEADSKSWNLFRKSSLNYNSFEDWYRITDPFTCPWGSNLYVVEYTSEQAKVLDDCWVSYNGEEKAFSFDGLNWFKIKIKEEI